MDLRVIRCDGGRDILQDGRLARLRRRHDKTALAFADRRRKIDHAGGDRALAVLHNQALIRINGSQVRELRAL